MVLAQDFSESFSQGVVLEPSESLTEMQDTLLNRFAHLCSGVLECPYYMEDGFPERE